ncbi:MAG: FtsX-like permease family protein [Steroidobacteraceae bacterium]
MTSARLWWRLWGAQWRAGPVRMLVPVMALALGIALASAVQLVNRSALAEFGRAARSLSGDADLVVQGPVTGFAERLYPVIARVPGVAVASPVLEVRATLANSREPLRVVALDPLRAAQVQPALLAEAGGRLRRFFAPDGIFLSARAAAALGVEVGDRLDVLVGSSRQAFEVSGTLSAAAYPHALGLMDIAVAQWRFDRLGILTRIDVRVRRGADVGAVRAAIARRLPPGLHVEAPAMDDARLASATRAYRVNLTMLALVAVLTAAFLVLAAQTLSLLRRRPSLALLRALGVTRGALRRLLAAEGAAMGALGAAIGFAGGVMLAGWMLRRVAGDLGAGQLQSLSGTLVVKPTDGVLFIALGALAAGLAAWLPAREATARPVAQALRAGDAEVPFVRARPWRAGGALAAIGAVLATLPAWHGLPIFGYAAIAALLLGGVLLVPSVAGSLLARWPQPRRPVPALAIAQLRGSSARTAIGFAAIVVSFSLTVAMAIMVHSFRESFIGWLDRTLPADLQLRVGQGGGTATLDLAAQAAVAATPGIARAHFRRSMPLALRRDAAPVQLIALPIDAGGDPDIEIVRRADAVAGTPAWISEAVVDLYRWRPGEHVSLPLGNGHALAVTVAGVFRDYGRSTGSVVVSRAAYGAATGDTAANEASLWLERDADAARVVDAIRARLGLGATLQVRTTAEIRTLSLRSFDRAFAITYGLEAIAVFIGLLGVGVATASTALARRAEFGMLRHVGLRRRQIVAMLAGEGMLTAAIGVGCALVLGGVLSIVLVFVVNRQSFLWSIDLAVPWVRLGMLAVLLVMAAAAAALLGGRAATSGEAVRAVREDW